MDIFEFASHGDTNALRALIETGNNVDLNAVDPNSQLTPVAIAAYCGHEETMDFLLEQGVNTDIPDGNLLMFAMSAGKGKIARNLLDRGMDLNATNGSGRTCLHVATGTTSTLVALLVEKGADVNHADQKGDTPLHVTCRNMNQLFVSMTLLDCGADINARNALERTPLHEACRYGQDAMALDLLSRGVDVDVVDKNGRTPLHDAVISGIHK
jgi:ankyrin repeat protein